MGAISTIATIAIRATQIIFAAVIVGLAGTLIKEQLDGTTLPATLGYMAFAGAFGMVMGFVGLAAIWVEMLQGIIMMGIDALAAIFYLAGGLVSVRLRLRFSFS